MSNAPPAIRGKVDRGNDCAGRDGYELIKYARIKMQMSRGVAQPGSAPALGAGGLEFKSPRPDHSLPRLLKSPASRRVSRSELAAGTNLAKSIQVRFQTMLASILVVPAQS